MYFKYQQFYFCFAFVKLLITNSMKYVIHPTNIDILYILQRLVFTVKTTLGFAGLH